LSFCRFHPLVKADRYCEYCDSRYCDACGDESTLLHNPEAEQLCLVCESRLAPLNNESSVPPFWRVLHEIYLYPSSLSAVMVIVLTAFLTALFGSATLLLIFPTLIIIHYCFACLRSTAQGRMEPPDFEKSIEGSISPIFFVFIVIFVALFIVGLTDSALGTGFAILIGLLFICVLPAAILVIAIEEQLLPALNLGRLMAIVSATGTSYFVALLFILIMFFSLASLQYALVLDDSSFLGVFLQSLIGNYYNVVIFHILGYLIYQNQHEFGSFVNTSKQETVFRGEEELNNAKIEALVKAGRYSAALELSKHQIKLSNAPMWQWQRCLRLLLATQSNKSLQAFSDVYFPKLRSFDKHDAMAEAYIEMRQRLPAIHIKEPSIQLEIADALMDIGKYKYVVLLLRQFHKTSSDRANLTRAFGILAKAYRKIPGQSKNADIFDRQVRLMTENN